MNIRASPVENLANIFLGVVLCAWLDLAWTEGAGEVVVIAPAAVKNAKC